MKQKYKYPMGEYLTDITHYVKPYKKKFYWGVFFRFTSDVARLYPAIAVSKIVRILSQRNLSNSYHDIAVIFIYWGLTTIYFSFFHNFSKYLGYQVSDKASLDFYKDVLAHVLKLDFSWQEKEGSGNKMKRVDRGQDGLQLTIRKIFNPIIEVVVNTVGIVAIFFSVNKGLGFGLILFIATFYLLGTYFLKKAIRQERIVSKANENLGGFTFEALNNVQTIKSLGIDKGVVRIVRHQLKVLLKKIKKRIFYYQSLYGITNTFDNFFKYFTVLYLSFGVLKGTGDVGLLVLFIGLYGRVSESAGELTEVVQDIAMAKIWMSRAKNILNSTPTIENPSKVETQFRYNTSWDELWVHKVKFAYRKNQALNEISFKIKRNEKVGIVGLSGAGKTTLFKLFLDLYENYKGDILLDNLSLKKIQRQSYIDHVAVVLQDTELFDMSLRNNIEIASVKKKNNPNLILEVVEKAHLAEVVEKLPKGIDSIVGEKGIKLSGGQRQRVGIARALYREPDILLLDEATSHLDAHSEKEIQKAILENVNNFTTIVIAHRLSTIKAMDKIVVLENGKVVEQGSFDNLIAKNGSFAKMWTDQKI